jgi:hypothetical protein
MIVHGYEVATKYEKLLDERRFSCSLFHHFKNYDTTPIYGLKHMFSYYQSHNICEEEGFARI